MKRMTLILGLCVSLAVLPMLWAGANLLKPGAGPDSWVNDLSPISAADWTYERAGHLLERAGFGGTPADIERLAAMTPQAAVDFLVDFESIDNPQPEFEPSGIFEPGIYPILEGCAVAMGIRKGYRDQEAIGIKVTREPGETWLQPIVNESYYHIFANRAESGRVAHWWANRMLNTQRPLEEKLTLFWHGHFATSAQKVRDYRLMVQHIETLRTNAVEDFRTILMGMAKDPAMLVWLDNGLNVKGASNENFAREIMELFAMGVGNYTEKDIREAARAFTGWTQEELKFVIKPEMHDEGEKEFLGENGQFDGEQVIDIILKQKVTAQFLSDKMYRFFVREEMTPELSADLAGRFRDSGYEVKPLLKTIFLSKDFYSPASYATQIKSPVQLAVSTYKKLGITEIPGLPDFRQITSELGQELCFPPNVAGWEGGPAWINPATLLERGNFARQIFFARRDDGASGGLPERYRKRQEEMMLMENPDSNKSKDSANTANVKEIKKQDESKSAINKLSTPDFNLRDGVIRGYLKTIAKVKRIPRTRAKIDLFSIAKRAELETAEDTVDYFIRRFLRVPLNSSDRKAMVAFLESELGGPQVSLAVSNKELLEKTLRQLVHLIMSTPEYQLS